MVVRGMRILPEVRTSFAEYNEFSNRTLNLKKTVAIPLFLPGDWVGAVGRVREVLSTRLGSPSPG